MTQATLRFGADGATEASRRSYDAFVKAAWSYFSLPMVDELSGPSNLGDLYQFAAGYNPGHLPPKSALSGSELDAAMALFVEATSPHRIVMQASEGDWPDLTDQVPALAQYYIAKGAGGRPVTNATAEALSGNYLHIYPAVPADGDWRIGINVEPRDMAAAVVALTPLLNRFPDIDHMKFLSPGDAAKADSALVYLRHTESGYDALKLAILEAAGGLRLQPRIGAMWEPVAPGIGEAAEPPREVDGESFTSYRCQIAFLAYWQYRQQIQTASFDGFRDFLSQVMALFGIDTTRPFAQGPLKDSAEGFAQWWQAFEVLRRQW